MVAGVLEVKMSKLLYIAPALMTVSGVCCIVSDNFIIGAIGYILILSAGFLIAAISDN